jgi:hypothetical protein
MGLRVIACLACCLAWLPHAVAQTGAAPSATQPVEPPPLSAQGETALPAAAAPAAAPSPVPPAAAPPSAVPPSAVPPTAVPPTAAATEATQTAAPPAAGAVAPIAAAPPAPTAQRVPADQSHDLERPVLGARNADADAGKLLLRLSLGLQAALLGISSELQLMHPCFASFDIGYAPWAHWALLLRVSSWLSFASYVSQFVGAGVSYWFSANMFVSTALGVAMHQGSQPHYDYSFQGLAAQLDLGQEWPLSAVFNFAVGAHFEGATHWLGNSSVSDFGMGLFVSASYR